MKICLICKLAFKITPNRRKTAKYCSIVCHGKARLGTGTFIQYVCVECGQTGTNHAIRKYCSQQCRAVAVGKSKIGTHLSYETRHKIHLAHIGKPNFLLRGENHPNWRGGISKLTKTERNIIMQTIEYKNWRRLVFERDAYTCQKCGQRGGELNADHIKPFAFFPELRFTISNGQTLCIICHRTTNTWGFRAIIQHKKEVAHATG